MVEIDRVNICIEISIISSHLVLPREKYLKQVLYIFVYLSKYYNTEIVFDTSDPEINKSDFEKQDWTSSEFGNKPKKVFSENIPEPRDIGFIMSAKIDTDHAGDTITRRSRTGFLVYLNCVLIY